MSSTLLHRAPSHQPPPPSASKSRSRSSCHTGMASDGNEGNGSVPNLHPNTAHYCGAVVEVDAAAVRRHAPSNTKIAFTHSTHELLTTTTANATRYTSLFHAANPHAALVAVDRSRLDAEEDPLMESLSYSDAATSLAAEGRKGSTASSVIFEGADEEDNEREHSTHHSINDHNHNNAGDDEHHYGGYNSDMVSTSFCCPLEGVSGVSGRVDHYRRDGSSSVDESPNFYEEQRGEPDRSTGLRHSSETCLPIDNTAASRGPLGVTVHRPLHLGPLPDHTSRRLVFPVSAMLTSPMEVPTRVGEGAVQAVHVTDAQAGQRTGWGSAEEKPAEEESKCASSPQLHYQHALSQRGTAVHVDALHARPSRMAPLIPPPTSENESDVEEGTSMAESCTELLGRATESMKADGFHPGGCAVLHDSPLPPTRHADLDRADAEMKTAMTEMAARLHSHERSARRGSATKGAKTSSAGLFQYSGAVSSKGNSPSTASDASDTQDEPHLLHRQTSDDLADDSEEVPHLVRGDVGGGGGGSDEDLVRSVRDADISSVALSRRNSHLTSPSETEKGFVGRGAAASVAYTFFSTALPPPVDRRARIQELAKILREGEALFTTPKTNVQEEEEEAEEVVEVHDASVAVGGDTKVPAADRKASHCLKSPVRHYPRHSLPPPPPPSSHHYASLTPPLARATSAATVNVSRDASLSPKATLLHSPPALATFTAQQAPPTPPSPVLLARRPGGSDDGDVAALSASTDDVARGASWVSGSPSTSALRRHRPPPRMLCPPTPSPSRSRSDDFGHTLGSPRLEGTVALSGEGEGSAAGVPAASKLANWLRSMTAETVPAVRPYSACGTVYLTKLNAPFTTITTNASDANTAPGEAAVSDLSDPAARHVSSVQHSPLRASLVEGGEDEDSADSTASLVTALSEPDEKNDVHHRSVLCGPTDASVCAAEEVEAMPLPLSPRWVREHSASAPSAEKSSLTAGDAVMAAEESDGCVESWKQCPSAPSAVCRSLSRLRRLEENSASHHHRSGYDEARVLTSPLPTSHRTSPLKSSAVVSRVSDAASRRALANDKDYMESREETEEDEVSLPVLPSSHASLRPHSKSRASDLSSPLPVRPRHTIDGSHHHDEECEEEEEEDGEAHLRYDLHAKQPHVHELEGQGGRPTWQSETMSAEAFNYNDEEEIDDDDDARTHMEAMLQRAEAKNAVLRLELTTESRRASAAEDALQARNVEIEELHELVDRLQAELAAVRMAVARRSPPAMVPVGVGASLLTSPLCVDAAVQTVKEAPVATSEPVEAVVGSNESEEWRRRHDGVAQELAAVKIVVAEQLAVLDRLGLTPPFPEDVIAAAQRRLRHVKVVNAVATPSPAPLAAPAKMSVGDKNSLVTLLAQRKQQQLQQQQQQRDAAWPVFPRVGSGRSSSRADTARGVAPAKENRFTS